MNDANNTQEPATADSPKKHRKLSEQTKDKIRACALIQAENRHLKGTKHSDAIKLKMRLNQKNPVPAGSTRSEQVNLKVREGCKKAHALKRGEAVLVINEKIYASYEQACAELGLARRTIRDRVADKRSQFKGWLIILKTTKAA